MTALLIMQTAAANLYTNIANCYCPHSVLWLVKWNNDGRGHVFQAEVMVHGKSVYG